MLPSELLIVDLGSTDTTLEVLRSWRPPVGTVLKVVESPRASIAQGRNLAIETASFDHIAVTHGAVRLHTEWLSRLWMALADGADLVSGDIRPAGNTLLERTIGLLETLPVNEIDSTSHLPPSVSLAFSKGLWDAVGGYPEWLTAGQDAVFAAAMRHAGAEFSLASARARRGAHGNRYGGYLSASFHNSRAEGEAEIFAGGQSVRAAFDVAALLALMLLRRSGPASSLAMVALSIRVGSLVRQDLADPQGQRRSHRDAGGDHRCGARPRRRGQARRILGGTGRQRGRRGGLRTRRMYSPDDLGGTRSHIYRGNSNDHNHNRNRCPTRRQENGRRHRARHRR